MKAAQRILVIKTGAAGDIVRTSILFHLFPVAEWHWICSADYFPLFADRPGLTLYAESALPESVFSIPFDLVISLEEDFPLADYGSRFQYKQWEGLYWQNGLHYTANAASWYDRSLCSALGRDQANALKKAGTRTYQDYLCQMLGKSFNGEPYAIFQPVKQPATKRIGIETRAAGRWPNKIWEGYTDLSARLTAAGYEVFHFVQRDHLRDYMQEIARCELLVTGDTLSMHLALAYNIPTVALFICTQPTEIFGYGCLEKIVHPNWEDYFFAQSYNPAAVGGIPVETVFNRVTNLYQKRQETVAG